MTAGDLPRRDTDQARALLRKASDFLAEVHAQCGLPAVPLASQAQLQHPRIERSLQGGAGPSWLDGGLEALAMAREEGFAPDPSLDLPTS